MRRIGQMFRSLIPVIALVALVVFLVGAGRRERARLEKNKAILMRALDAWNKGDMALADEVYSSNTIRYVDTVPEGIIRDRDATKQFIMACRTAWPDLNITALDIIAEGDKVVARWAVRGTFTGAVEGWPPPNGKEMAWETLEMYRFADGKIVESRVFSQDLVLMSQMGMKLVPAQ